MQYNEILCNPTQNKIHNSSENHLTQSTNTNWYFQMAVGTKSGTLGPSEDLRGAQKGILRPKQALFACFWPFSWTGWFQIGYNSAGWAGNSAPMLWTPHKPIFETKNVHQKIWLWKLGAEWRPKHFHTLCLGGRHPYHVLGPLNGPLRPPKGYFEA